MINEAIVECSLDKYSILGGIGVGDKEHDGHRVVILEHYPMDTSKPQHLWVSSFSRCYCRKCKVLVNILDSSLLELRRFGDIK